MEFDEKFRFLTHRTIPYRVTCLIVIESVPSLCRVSALHGDDHGVGELAMGLRVFRLRAKGAQPAHRLAL